MDLPKFNLKYFEKEIYPSLNFIDLSSEHSNLKFVAIHEIGHALGLEHSADENSIMAAYYTGYQPNYQLDEITVKSIQNLYG